MLPPFLSQGSAPDPGLVACGGPVAPRRSLAGAPWGGTRQRSETKTSFSVADPSLAPQEFSDHGGLAGLFQQKAVVSVGRVDDVELDLPASSAQRVR